MNGDYFCLELESQSSPLLAQTTSVAPRCLQDKVQTSYTMSSMARHGQNLWAAPTITVSAPLSDSKAVAHLLPELQLWKSHGVLDTCPQVSPSPLYPLCPQCP